MLIVNLCLTSNWPIFFCASATLGLNRHALLYIEPPKEIWWVPPKTTIEPNKSEAKQNHDQLAQNHSSQNHLIIYTEGSGRLIIKLEQRLSSPHKELFTKHFSVQPNVLLSTQKNYRG